MTIPARSAGMVISPTYSEIMTELRIGIIGCGRPRGTPGATGGGIAHAHAKAYLAYPGARIVALADVVLANAEAFQADYGADRLYIDYIRMLREEKLDMVSVCVWPHLHAEMVIAAAEAGTRAVYCEKPMAVTYADARRMVEACAAAGTQLGFNHQRRFGAPFTKARALLRDGAIGRLQRMEAVCPNLYDWGTHWFDMLFFFNEETPAEWVLGQVEAPGGPTVFGVKMERQAVSWVGFRNGVTGLALTRVTDPFEASIRLIGADGMIEVGLQFKPMLRMWGRGQSAWTPVDAPTTEWEGFGATVAASIADALDALKEGREPETSGARALKATELIFATYESARRGRRIDLPLVLVDDPRAAVLGG